MEVTSSIHGSPPLSVVALRIDLKNPARKIFITPGTKSIDSGSAYIHIDHREKNFSSRTTSRFLEDFECIAAINATPYNPFRVFQGFPQRAVGMVISDGILYSSYPDYAVFSLTKDNEVNFTESPFKFEDISDIAHAVGGFFIILSDGENIGFKGKRNPLSILGSSYDERYLFLVVIDGEDKNWSIGASLWEGSEWMKALGAYDAMILDGGGSSTLVIREEDGKSLLLNKPSGFNMFYRERPVAVHLGIR